MAATTRRYLKANDVLARYQLNSMMTLWRWLNDARLCFPQPVVIRGVRFFPEDELDAFDERQRRVKIPSPFTKSTRSEKDFAAVIAARAGEAI